MKDDVNIQLVNCPLYRCSKCEVEKIPYTVQQLIHKLVNEKKKYRDLPPYIYVNVSEVIRIPILRTN